MHSSYTFDHFMQTHVFSTASTTHYCLGNVYFVLAVFQLMKTIWIVLVTNTSTFLVQCACVCLSAHTHSCSSEAAPNRVRLNLQVRISVSSHNHGRRCEKLSDDDLQVTAYFCWHTSGHTSLLVVSHWNCVLCNLYTPLINFCWGSGVVEVIRSANLVHKQVDQNIDVCHVFTLMCVVCQRLIILSLLVIRVMCSPLNAL